MTEQQAPRTQIQHDWHMVRRAYEIGYSQGLQEGLAEGPNHPAVIESVKRVFGDWDGATAARQRSAARFHCELQIGDAA
jgi:hypothetical protein